MSIELLSMEKRENKLLNRIELIAELRFGSGTPTRKEIRSLIASLLKKPEGLVFVRKISTKYGRREAVIKVNVYNNRDEALQMEPEHIIRRNEGGSGKIEGEKNG